MNWLNICDGISCGQVAINRANKKKNKDIVPLKGICERANVKYSTVKSWITGIKRTKDDRPAEWAVIVTKTGEADEGKAKEVWKLALILHEEYKKFKL